MLIARDKLPLRFNYSSFLQLRKVRTWSGRRSMKQSASRKAKAAVRGPREQNSWSRPIVTGSSGWRHKSGRRGSRVRQELLLRLLFVPPAEREHIYGQCAVFVAIEFSISNKRNSPKRQCRQYRWPWHPCEGPRCCHRSKEAAAPAAWERRGW